MHGDFVACFGHTFCDIGGNVLGSGAGEDTESLWKTLKNGGEHARSNAAIKEGTKSQTQKKAFVSLLS